MKAGVDEAGRGPLAGPVFAAAVILDETIKIDGLNDSKKISETKRLELADEIKLKAISWSVQSCSALEIDKTNILKATLEAMKKAIEKFNNKPKNNGRKIKSLFRDLFRNEKKVTGVVVPDMT